jgi:hypothetical protein
MESAAYESGIMVRFSQTNVCAGTNGLVWWGLEVFSEFNP